MKELRIMFRFIRPYLTGYGRQLTVYILVGILFYSLSIVQPFILGQYVDRMIGNPGMAPILTGCAVFLLVTICQILLSYHMKMTGTRLNVRVSTHVKAQFFRHFQQTSPRFHLQKSAAGMADQINNDVEYLILFFLNLAMQLPGKIACFLLTGIYIFSVDIWCGIAVLLMIPLLVLLYQLFSGRIFRTSRAFAEARNLYFAALAEQFGSVRSIRLNQLTEVLSRRFYQCGSRLAETDVENEKAAFPYRMINEKMDVFLKIFLFLYGGFAIWHGRMSVGEFTILYSYMTLMTAAFSYFLGIGQDIQEHMVFYGRLKTLSDVPEEGNGTVMPDALREVSVVDLHFSYDDREILHGFSQVFQQDQIYCLAGQNGAGKSTLTNLLLGLYVSETGSAVFYNGIPIREIDLYRMRAEQIGVSEQEPVMLDGTVGFNVTYREVGGGDTERLEELFETVNFTNGETDCGDLEELLALDAATLSGGQKQKVSIVKALYKNPRLLVLDEPTSALDAESRHRLAGYLRAHAAGRITIIISHDRELMDLADQVITMGGPA